MPRRSFPIAGLRRAQKEGGRSHPLWCIQLLFLLEGVFAKAADRALEVLGKLLEGGAGGDAVIGIAEDGVVFVTAGADVFHSCNLLLAILLRDTRYTPSKLGRYEIQDIR